MAKTKDASQNDDAAEAERLAAAQPEPQPDPALLAGTIIYNGARPLPEPAPTPINELGPNPTLGEILEYEARIRAS
jgi:hypothetical protein